MKPIPPEVTAKFVKFLETHKLIVPDENGDFTITEFGVQIGRVLFMLSILDITYDPVIAQMVVAKAEQEAVEYHQDMTQTEEKVLN